MGGLIYDYDPTSNPDLLTNKSESLDSVSDSEIVDKILGKDTKSGSKIIKDRKNNNQHNKYPISHKNSGRKYQHDAYVLKDKVLEDLKNLQRDQIFWSVKSNSADSISLASEIQETTNNSLVDPGGGGVNLISNMKVQSDLNPLYGKVILKRKKSGGLGLMISGGRRILPKRQPDLIKLEKDFEQNKENEHHTNHKKMNKNMSATSTSDLTKSPSNTLSSTVEIIGAVVTQVQPNSPAQKVGIMPGDEVLEWNSIYFRGLSALEINTHIENTRKFDEIVIKLARYQHGVDIDEKVSFEGLPVSNEFNSYIANLRIPPSIPISITQAHETHTNGASLHGQPLRSPNNNNNMTYQRTRYQNSSNKLSLLHKENYHGPLPSPFIPDYSNNSNNYGQTLPHGNLGGATHNAYAHHPSLNMSNRQSSIETSTSSVSENSRGSRGQKSNHNITLHKSHNISPNSMHHYPNSHNNFLNPNSLNPSALSSNLPHANRPYIGNGKRTTSNASDSAMILRTTSRNTMNGIVGIIQAKFWIEYDIRRKQKCLFASILSGADFQFRTPEHRLWFTLELDSCGSHNNTNVNPYVPETLADRLKNISNHLHNPHLNATDLNSLPGNKFHNSSNNHRSPNHMNTMNHSNAHSMNFRKNSGDKNKQHMSRVLEYRAYTVWPEWDETICVAVLNECLGKSLWLKFYDDDMLLGQLYLDASEIDVDNTIRWYELESGFER